MFREGLLGGKQWSERSTCNELNLGKLCLLPGKKSSHLCSLPLDSPSRSRIRIFTRTFPSIIWAAISPTARTPTPVVRVTLAGRGWDWSSCELIPPVTFVGSGGVMRLPITAAACMAVRGKNKQHQAGHRSMLESDQGVQGLDTCPHRESIGLHPH